MVIISTSHVVSYGRRRHVAIAVTVACASNDNRSSKSSSNVKWRRRSGDGISFGSTLPVYAISFCPPCGTSITARPLNGTTLVSRAAIGARRPASLRQKRMCVLR
jgi:hypothetical protein